MPLSKYHVRQPCPFAMINLFHDISTDLCFIVYFGDIPIHFPWYGTLGPTNWAPWVMQIRLTSTFTIYFCKMYIKWSIYLISPRFLCCQNKNTHHLCYHGKGHEIVANKLPWIKIWIVHRIPEISTQCVSRIMTKTGVYTKFSGRLSEEPFPWLIQKFPCILIFKIGQPGCQLNLSEGQIRLDLTSGRPLV